MKDEPHVQRRCGCRWTRMGDPFVQREASLDMGWLALIEEAGTLPAAARENLTMNPMSSEAAARRPAIRRPSVRANYGGYSVSPIGRDTFCHAGESRHPYSRGLCLWIPACAGMT